ncbi:hypothetical protein RD792_002750 [Penstemon davidsonii]|uniref:Uncharacterized protein n=1 Tax=Penstemon davidsonii TaxID=160366 RepID=A0ABR0DSW5_9LAMI|nr:hypothetical protein RD792_002750 [Penstemon davidsonii]
MAFSTGYLFPRFSLHPRTREIAKIRNSSEPFNVAKNITNQWRINHEDIALAPSGLHQSLFLNGSTSFPGKFPTHYEQKKDEVRHLFKKSKGDPIESLIIVDAIQRLGLDYHFQEEIETILQQQYDSSTCVHKYQTLHDVSLFFRLLRQHGHYVSAGKDGKFKKEIRGDINGLMELYEAVQLSFEGEVVLDEANKFSSQILHEYLANYTDSDRSKMLVISNKLRHPFHKSIPRILMTERYFKDFGGRTNDSGTTLRELASMDLHMRQSVYQEELLQISKWWNEVGLTKNDLKHARNQPLKWYTWSMAIIDDSSLSWQRVELTKSIAFIYLIDDIFDLYGTLDELISFTEAVNRWDYAAIKTLPNYMKMCYRALLDTTNEIGRKIYKKHGYNPIDSLKTTWVNLCNAFLIEAKWLTSGELPPADKYLENGKVSSGVHVVLVHLFFLLGHGQANINSPAGAVHLNDTCQIISSVATILRLLDDLGTAKDEHQDGKDGSYVECYRKENVGLSIEQAREHVNDMVASEWKSLNKECFLNLNHVISASSFTKASLNLARMVPLMYSYDDNQRLPVLEEYVNFMLFNQGTSLDLEHLHQDKTIF